MKEVKAKGNWPAPGKTRFGTIVKARAMDAVQRAGPRDQSAVPGGPSRPLGGLRAGASPPFSGPPSPRHPRAKPFQSTTEPVAATRTPARKTAETGLERAQAAAARKARATRR